MGRLTDDFIREHVSRFCSGKGIDIGCGDSPITENVIGIDFEHIKNDKAFPRTSAVLVGEWEIATSSMPDESLDFIYSSGLLDNYSIPFNIFANWGRLIGNHGKIIIVLEKGTTTSKNNVSYFLGFLNSDDFLDSMPDGLRQEFDVKYSFENDDIFGIVFEKKVSKKICIVYLTYNSEDAILCNLPRLLTYSVGKHDIIAVDNASSDNTVSVLNKFGITPIVTEENVGYTKGINIGIQKAVELGYDWIVIANPDIGALPYWDTRTFNYVKKDYGIVGVLLTHRDQINHAGGDIFSTEFPQTYPLIEYQVNDEYYVYGDEAYGASPCMHRISRCSEIIPEKVAWVTFGFAILNAKMVKEIGLLNETFFLYNSDVEYCLRAWEKDWDVWYIPVEYHHPMSSSTSGTGQRWLLETARKDMFSFSAMKKQLIQGSENKWEL